MSDQYVLVNEGLSWGVAEPARDSTQWCGRDKGKAEAYLLEVLASPLCHECGQHVGKMHWYADVVAQLQERGLCFHCNYWVNTIAKDADGKAIVIDGIHYRDGGIKNGNTQWNGFGGQWWHIRMHDGRLIETNNLWCQGTIPDHFRYRLPDNAAHHPATMTPPQLRRQS